MWYYLYFHIIIKGTIYEKNNERLWGFNSKPSISNILQFEEKNNTKLQGLNSKLEAQKIQFKTEREQDYQVR